MLKKISDTSKGLIDDNASQMPNILMNSGFVSEDRYWNLDSGVNIDSVLFEGVKSVKNIQTGFSTAFIEVLELIFMIVQWVKI